MLPLLIMILLTVGIALFITYPLLTGSRSPRANAQDHDVADLMVRRDQLFHDIRETELDYRTGKLSEQDYEANIAQLKTEAADAIEHLESMGRSTEPRRPKTSPAKARKPEDVDVEGLVAAARRQRGSDGTDDAAKRVVCPSCRASNPSAAQFCMKCGMALAAAAKETS